MTRARAADGGTVLGYAADVGDQAALREWVSTAAEALGGANLVVDGALTRGVQF